MPVLEKTDIAWHRDIIESKRDYHAELVELQQLKKEYKTYSEAFQDFELSLNDAYAKNRSSSYAKAHDFQNTIGVFLQKLAHAVPDDAASVKRIVREFERVWNNLLPAHFNKLFVQKRKFLIGPLTISKTLDSATHFQWILYQTKILRKTWTRMDYYIDEAIKEAKERITK